MGIQISSVVNAIVYAAIGIVVFAGAFLIIDKVTDQPLDQLSTTAVLANIPIAVNWKSSYHR
jgi:hypothetical protein